MARTGYLGQQNTNSNLVNILQPLPFNQAGGTNQNFGIHFAYDIINLTGLVNDWKLRIWCINATGNNAGAGGNLHATTTRWRDVAVTTQTKLLRRS
jgi:hypothetical protein